MNGTKRKKLSKIFKRILFMKDYLYNSSSCCRLLSPAFSIYTDFTKNKIQKKTKPHKKFPLNIFQVFNNK